MSCRHRPITLWMFVNRDTSPDVTKEIVRTERSRGINTLEIKGDYEDAARPVFRGNAKLMPSAISVTTPEITKARW
jgi:hypothetical protein